MNPRACGLMWGTERKWEFIVDRHSQHPERVGVEAIERMYAIAEEDGCWDWWAHNGGRYDVCLILDAVVRAGWQASGHVAGSRVVVMHLKPPDAKRAIRLYDSQALVPSSLKDAAKDFHLSSEKFFTQEDYAVDVRKWPVKRMEQGCKVDCELVLQLVGAMEAEILEQGGVLKATIASVAMATMRARINLPDSGDWPSVNTIAREAYHGGRVEVFHHTPKGVLTEYDVNSSYPWAMTQRLPWRNPVDVEGADTKRLLETGEGVLRCEVFVPSATHLPTLPVVRDGIFFPTGRIRGWWHAHELRYAMTQGCRVEKTYGGIRFDAGSPFKEFVADLYEGKRTATGAKRTTFKLILNSAYGKFGQAPERENLRVFPTDEDALAYVFNAKDGTCKMISSLSSKFVAVSVNRWAKHAHYALAGAITAHSRILLHKYLVKAKGLAYCDTDSVHCDESTHFSTGDGLGQMKIEIERMRAEYWAPKLYRLEPMTGTHAGQLIHASKGFEHDNRDPVRDAALFRAAVRGELSARQSMTLVKTQMVLGGKASRRTSARAWSGRSMKRRPLVDGSTVPWTIEEVEAKKHLTAHARNGEKAFDAWAKKHPRTVKE